MAKNFLQKLETKFIKKRNKESSNNKYNSNKFTILYKNMQLMTKFVPLNKYNITIRMTKLLLK